MSEYIRGLYSEYDFTPTEPVLERYKLLTPRQLELCVWWSHRRGAIGGVSVYEGDEHAHNFLDLADSLGVDAVDLMFDVSVLVDAGILERGEENGVVCYIIVASPFKDPPPCVDGLPF